MNKITKIIIGAIVLILLVWGGVKLFGSKNEKTNEPIKIGVILPLSVKAANLGEDGQNGINLALEEINKDKKNIEVIFEDDKCDTKEAVSAYQKLKQEKINIIIGAICSNSTLAIAPLAENDKIILITPGSAADKISDAGDYIFRNHVTMTQKTGKLGELISQKFQKIATIYDQSNDAFVLGEKIVVDKFQIAGKNIGLREGFQKDQTDFRTQLIKIKNDKPDVVYVGSLMPGAALIVKQINELKIQAQIVSDDGFVTDQKFLEAVKNLSEGIIFATTKFDRDTNTVFWDAYTGKFSKNPTIFATQTYDTLKILSKIINEKCKNDNSVCVKDELYKIKNYPGVAGDVSFDDNGDVVKQIIIKIVKNGQFVPYAE